MAANSKGTPGGGGEEKLHQLSFCGTNAKGPRPWLASKQRHNRFASGVRKRAASTRRRPNAAMDNNIVRVFLVDGTFRDVRYDEGTTVERVQQVVLEGIGIATVAASHFALRLLTGLAPATSADSVWLHPCLPVNRIRVQYGRHLLPSTSQQQLRFELRVRFIPQSAVELLLTESKAFIYLHEQVFSDFLGHVAWKANQDSAIELAALKVCRDYAEKQTKMCIDHKIDLDGLDVNSAIQKFIPNTVLCNPNTKHQVLKKQFIHLLKKFSTLPTTDSVLRSLSILIDIVKFDVEVFNASLGAGWESPIDLLIGPEVGLSYRVNERCDTSRLAELRSVLEITLRRLEHSTDKTVLQIKLSGTSQPLLITVATFDMAESLGHLIDGYQMMFNQQDYVFKMKGFLRCESLDMRNATQSRPARAVTSVDHDVRLRRELVTLKELIGGGQFGNVYKGILAEPNAPPLTVAIKVCKVDNEPADTQLILQEAHLMRNLRHDHIISLIGVCMDNPIWMVMELAPLGELRQYLQSNKATLELSTLILFSLQVAKALQYLHGQSFVHRDVAARNVLVSSPKCVKLTDFGLSRALDRDNVYTASRGKLPIKWLAPESINFREFSMASDVWMFGVCLWEILSWGVKPWQNVANADVITQIEAGGRPACPISCPIALYNYLERNIWCFEAKKRPTTTEIVEVMESVKQQLDKRVLPDEIRVKYNAKPVPVILTNISSVPNLTLWRTLEEQRRQAEEDDKWLEEQEEEEELAAYDPETEDANLNKAVSAISLSSNKMNGSVVNGVVSPLAMDRVRKAAEAVTSAAEHLHNAFNKNMNHDTFMLAIRDIILRVREMFAEATEALKEIDGDRRRQIEHTETLIGNDTRQLSEAMQKLVSNSDPVAASSSRREMVKIAREMARNCDRFFQLLCEPPRSPSFQMLLTDC